MNVCGFIRFCYLVALLLPRAYMSAKGQSIDTTLPIRPIRRTRLRPIRSDILQHCTTDAEKQRFLT